MSLVKEEHVLVVPTELFHALGYFQGFCDQIDRYRDSLFDPVHTSYRPRSEVEQDPSFKQLIPYVIFRIGGAGNPQIFQYRRGKGQGEKRLHALRSVGVGGHISSDDAESSQAYETGMERELAEEVRIETTYAGRCAGLINDDSNPVGQVHLGIVHVLDVDEPHVWSRELDLVDAGFRPLSQLISELDQFETWSQICLRWLGGQ